MAEKGQKIAVFEPEGPNSAKIKKGLDILLLFPRDAVYQISENLAHQIWRKCFTNGRADEQD